MLWLEGFGWLIVALVIAIAIVWFLAELKPPPGAASDRDREQRVIDAENHNAIAAGNLGEVRFPAARKGYDPAAVDSVIDAVAADLAAGKTWAEITIPETNFRKVTKGYDRAAVDSVVAAIQAAVSGNDNSKVDAATGPRD